MGGARFAQPVLAEAYAVALPVQQHPTRTSAQPKHLRERSGRYRECNTRAGPALRGCGRIEPPGDARVVRRRARLQLHGHGDTCMTWRSIVRAPGRAVTPQHSP
ncbi:hypothetical protein G6F59_016206 [Rhizopus arrhizus]|nr:hypothetical protein G6F59_016206 [Rhizopus arrhizus]